MEPSQDTRDSGATITGLSQLDDARLQPGDRLGRFVVETLIGAGGMGRVYRALDPELSRVVALKVLRRQIGGKDAESARRRMLREGQAMASLNHPNVVPVFDVDTAGGAVFIAMECIDGVTLRQWLARKTPPWTEVVEAMRQAGAGLSAAHAVGLVHRDFKPGNVLVGADGRVRVMDFGLARGSETGSAIVTPRGADVSSVDFLASQPITKAGEVLGTPAYMAPEQHFGRPADAKSDQFAFCVTLYEALYGKRPFSDAEGFRALARAKDRGEVLRPPRGTGVPRWLHAAVMRGLSARKVDRWDSMQDLVDALQPARSARKRWIVGGAVAVGIVGAALALRAGGDDDRCAAGLQAFDAHWTVEARGLVHGALRASGRSYADPTFDRAAQHLDTWTGLWREAYAQSCAAPSGDANGESIACLVRHRAALSAAVRTLAEPRDGLVDKAVEIASSLPPASDCEHPVGDGVLARPNPSIRGEVEQVRSRLAEVEVLEVAGRFADGLTLVDAAVADAERLAYAPLLAEALRLHGNLLGRQGHSEAAASALERGYIAAVSVGDDATAARCASRLVLVHADALYQPAQAERWLDELQSRVARLSRAPQAEIWLAQAEGAVAMSRSDYAAAAHAYERGLVLFDAQEQVDPVRRGVLLHNLGVSFYRAGRFADARLTLVAAADVQQQAVGALHPSVAASLMALAGVHYEEGDHDAALRVAERALDLQRRTLGADHPDYASGLANLAGLLLAMDRTDAARAALRESLRIWTATEASDEGAAFALGSLGTLLLAVGELKEAEPVTRRALRLKIDALGEQHEHVSDARVLLGDVLTAQGQVARARQEYEQASRAYEQTLGPQHPRIATALLKLAQSQEADDPEQSQATYAAAASAAEHNRQWLEAGRAHFGVARMLGTAGAGAARERADAALQAIGRAPGDHDDERDKVKAWLADLG